MLAPTPGGCDVHGMPSRGVIASPERNQLLRREFGGGTTDRQDQGPRGAVTVVIADDHPAIVDSVGRYLELNGIAVVGTAADGDGAVAVCEDLKPAVALVDLRMPGLSGLGALERLRLRVPDTKLLVYTGVGDQTLVAHALEAGADGVIQKDASLVELVRAVRIVAGGKPYIDAALASLMLESGGVLEARLTRREIEVLQLLADGSSNETIASALHIAPDTVRTHLRKAMTKLRCSTRTQAVATAMRQSLIN
jgi:DNA-binding NarL/FixJ family response regulator